MFVREREREPGAVKDERIEEEDERGKGVGVDDKYKRAHAINCHDSFCPNG